MEFERKGLYNLLRMSWLLDPTDAIESWKVDDYRKYSLEVIFNRLAQLDIDLDRLRFSAFAENCDSPEELTDFLLADREADSDLEDRIYLLIFELWRRLVPEKQSLSILCDELDYQIQLYDKQEMENTETIQDTLAYLQIILDEHMDQGKNPHEIFEVICRGCGNNLEKFLYDFISDLIDSSNYAYASELVEGFSYYVKELKWFLLLRARIVLTSDLKAADELINHLIKLTENDKDLEFNLELLSFLVLSGEKEIFYELIRRSLPLLKFEEDFQDLLSIAADFFRCLDEDLEEQKIQQILVKRPTDFNQEFNSEDPDFSSFLRIVDKLLESSKR